MNRLLLKIGIVFLLIWFPALTQTEEDVRLKEAKCEYGQGESFAVEDDTSKVATGCSINITNVEYDDCILDIWWTSVGNTSGYVKIECLSNDIIPIGDGIEDSGCYEWTVPMGTHFGSSTRIKISDIFDSNCSDEMEFSRICLLGDVNTDCTISPGDALCAFQIYLNGGTPVPGDCDNNCALEAADTNCDDLITPGDALVIFQAYLDNLRPPLVCPPAPVLALGKKTTGLKLSLSQANNVPGEEIAMSINVNKPQGIKAFGFNLEYPDELLSFVKVFKSSLTKGWQTLEGRENYSGVICVGGYNHKGISTSTSGELVMVTFNVKEGTNDDGDLKLFNLVDDVAKAKVNSCKFSAVVDGVRTIDCSEVPTCYALEKNCPNPFNIVTEIFYQLPEVCYVNLEIYNLSGHKIQTLVSRNQGTGCYAACWDGCDEQGQKLTSGIYFCRLGTSKFSNTRKMKILLIK